MALIACCLTGTTGCLGTVGTRFITANEGDWAGEYPFKAFVYDVKTIASDWHSDHTFGIGIPLLATFAWPWDIATDALLLPVDLILWPFGFRKKSP